jgi:hypothetical protein
MQTFRLCRGQPERLKPRKKIIQDWLEADEGDPGFQLLTEEEIDAVKFFIYFHQHYLYVLLNFSFTCFLSCLRFSVFLYYINPDQPPPPSY